MLRRAVSDAAREHRTAGHCVARHQPPRRQRSRRASDAGFDDVLAGRWPEGQPIPLWDGKAGDRVAAELAQWTTRH